MMIEEGAKNCNNNYDKTIETLTTALRLLRSIENYSSSFSNSSTRGTLMGDYDKYRTTSRCYCSLNRCIEHSEQLNNANHLMLTKNKKNKKKKSMSRELS